MNSILQNLSRLIVFNIITTVSLPVFAQVSVNAGGDVNFNRDSVPALPNETYHKGRYYNWNSMTEILSSIFTEGINFANVETVISDRKLRSYNKTWNFISHPNSVEQLLDSGFNLFSVANNHAYDYGKEGLLETHYHMSDIKSRYPEMNWHGVGTLEEVTSPTEFVYQGVTVAFSAIGIFSAPRLYSKQDTVGALRYTVDSHYDAVIKGLKNSTAQFKILSIHQGREKVTSITNSEIKAFRRAVDEAGVNFVIGHHPHVVRPVEIYKGSLIAHSLGNLLLVGAVNIDNNKLGSDYGLALKSNFDWDESLQKYVVNFVEAVPLKGVHIKPYELSINMKKNYIKHLNKLNRNAFSSAALQFQYDQVSGRAFWDSSTTVSPQRP